MQHLGLHGKKIKKKKLIKYFLCFKNIRHSHFIKICFDHKYLSNTINKNYKNYTVGFVDLEKYYHNIIFLKFSISIN